MMREESLVTSIIALLGRTKTCLHVRDWIVQTFRLIGEGFKKENKKYILMEYSIPLPTHLPYGPFLLLVGVVQYIFFSFLGHFQFF